MENKLLTKKDIMKLLGVSLSKVNKDLKRGLPYYKLGSVVRFKQKEVEEFYLLKRE